MANARKIVSTVIGVMQGAIGALAIIFAFLLHYKIFNIQNALSQEAYPLYAVLLLIFGFVSIISGLFLIHR